jgi:hypothetical protein
MGVLSMGVLSMGVLSMACPADTHVRSVTSSSAASAGRRAAFPMFAIARPPTISVP